MGPTAASVASTLGPAAWVAASAAAATATSAIQASRRSTWFAACTAASSAAHWAASVLSTGACANKANKGWAAAAASPAWPCATTWAIAAGQAASAGATSARQRRTCCCRASRWYTALSNCWRRRANWLLRSGSCSPLPMACQAWSSLTKWFSGTSGVSSRLLTVPISTSAATRASRWATAVSSRWRAMRWTRRSWLRKLRSASRNAASPCSACTAASLVASAGASWLMRSSALSSPSAACSCGAHCASALSAWRARSSARACTAWRCAALVGAAAWGATVVAAMAAAGTSALAPRFLKSQLSMGVRRQGRRSVDQQGSRGAGVQTQPARGAV